MHPEVDSYIFLDEYGYGRYACVIEAKYSLLYNGYKRFAFLFVPNYVWVVNQYMRRGWKYHVYHMNEDEVSSGTEDDLISAKNKAEEDFHKYWSGSLF